MGEEKPQSDDVLDYPGLAAYLKMSAGTMRHWVMDNRIPYYKMGYAVRFSKRQIDLWLQEHNQGARVSRGKGRRGDHVSNGELFPVEDKGQ
jgi:excisionase family DNA binding protein